MEQLAQSLSDVYRVAMIAAVVIGFLMHNTRTPELALATNRTVAATGAILGVAVIGIVAARLLGWELPVIVSDRDATVAIVILIAVKVAIARVFVPGPGIEVAR